MLIRLYVAFFFMTLSLGFFGCNTVEKQQDPPWNLAAIAWTFRTHTFFETVDKVHELGLHYLGAFPGQELGGGMEGKLEVGMEADKKKKVLDYLAAKNVKLIDFGVYTPEGYEGWKALFDFAKEMGISNIVSEPAKEDLAMVAKLCETYQIPVAIHNHPAPSLYAHPDTLLAVLSRTSKYIGACADVGHWVRSGFDAVESLRKLEGRVYELHFKDITGAETGGVDTIWGTGRCNIEGLLKELKRQQFDGYLAIEYETNPEDNMNEIRKSLDYYQQVLQSEK